jgi:hypothetical protein
VWARDAMTPARLFASNPLCKRFSIGRVCVVADRGMISAEAIAELEARGLLYILGVRERTDKLGSVGNFV